MVLISVTIMVFSGTFGDVTRLAVAGVIHSRGSREHRGQTGTLKRIMWPAEAFPEVCFGNNGEEKGRMHGIITQRQSGTQHEESKKYGNQQRCVCVKNTFIAHN